MERVNAWNKYDEAAKKQVFDFAEDYRSFISLCKTERECVKKAVELAKKAGYSERPARQIGSLNLTKPNVVEYMNEILEKTKSEEVATTEEVLEFLTSVMRGDIAEQFGLDPAITDRTKAAQLLMKRFNDNQRMDLELTKLEIRFKENMPGEQDNILDALNITASEVWNN